MFCTLLSFAAISLDLPNENRWVHRKALRLSFKISCSEHDARSTCLARGRQGVISFYIASSKDPFLCVARCFADFGIPTVQRFSCARESMVPAVLFTSLVIPLRKYHKGSLGRIAASILSFPLSYYSQSTATLVTNLRPYRHSQILYLRIHTPPTTLSYFSDSVFAITNKPSTDSPRLEYAQLARVPPQLRRCQIS